MSSRSIGALGCAFVLGLGTLTGGAGIAEPAAVTESFSPRYVPEECRSAPAVVEPNGVDMPEAAKVGDRLDQALNKYRAYGGTYWNRSGGIRVRIAQSREDADQTRRSAAEVMSSTDQRRVGGIQVEASDVTNRDLLDWAADARNGLSHIKASDVLSVGFDRLCQHVIVYVSDPEGAELTAGEQERYYVSPPAVEQDHSRDTDSEPFLGGVRMWRDSNGRDDQHHILCTGGWAMLRNGIRYLASAGHCGDVPSGGSDNFYTTRYGEYIGWDSINPYEGDRRHDAMLIRGRTYYSPIWFGVWNTQNTRYTTGKYFSAPLIGTHVWVSAGRTGIVSGEVRDRYYEGDSTCEGAAVIVRYDPGETTQRGDSGSPWLQPNYNTSRDDDVLAVGVHICGDGLLGGLGRLSAIHNVEKWTGSTLIQSSP